MKIIITFPERGEIKKELNGLTLNLLAHIQGDVKINFPYRVTCGFCASSATRLVRARERELAPQWNGLALVQWMQWKRDMDGMVGARHGNKGANNMGRKVNNLEGQLKRHIGDGQIKDPQQRRKELLYGDRESKNAAVPSRPAVDYVPTLPMESHGAP